MTDWTPISPGDASWVPAVIETANTSAAESAAAAAASEAVATAKATAAASSASDAQGYASNAAASAATAENAAVTVLADSPEITTPTIYGDLTVHQVAISTAPTATASAASGNLTGTYQWSVTYVNASGETDRGAMSNSVTVSGKKVDLTSIPVSPDTSVTARKIYRNRADASDVVQQKLVATISDNITTTYTDNIADASLGANVPYINTTGAQVAIPDDTAANQATIKFGTQNVAVGRDALATNSGYSCTAVGGNALSSNTTGDRNSAFGLYALEVNTTGYQNTAGGVHSQGAGTTAFHNTSWGYAAMINNTIGCYNVAVGNQVLETSTNTSACTAIGYQAMEGHATPENCVAVGAYALAATGSSNSSISGSTAVGYQALKVCTADNNVAVGASAGLRVTTGEGNVLIGQSTATGMTTGQNNVAIGISAGGGLVANSNNTFIGALAGVNNTGDGGVFIGNYAGFYETAGSKFFVDNQLRSTEADARVSSLMYGVFDSDPASQTLRLNAAVNVLGVLSTNGVIDITASGQISFPSTQIPSSDPNTLDDYEEGTWTPADTSGASLSLTINSAKYTKIGRMVNIQAYIAWPSTADASDVALGGIPFAVPANGFATGSVATDSGLALVARVRPVSGSTNLEILKNDNSSPKNSDMSGKFAMFSITYMV